MNMVLDRRQSDEQRVCDLIVGEPGSNECGDFELSFGEYLEAGVGSRADIDHGLASGPVNRDGHVLLRQLDHFGDRKVSGPLTKGRKQLPHLCLCGFVDQGAEDSYE